MMIGQGFRLDEPHLFYFKIQTSFIMKTKQKNTVLEDFLAIHEAALKAMMVVGA